MGNSQSKSTQETALQDKALLERLRAMQFEKKEDMESDYVHVDCDEKRTDRSALKTRLPEGLAVSDVEEWQTNLLKDPKNRLAILAFTKIAPRDILSSLPTKISDAHVFNTTIPFEGGPITNQRSSGRCWLFASTNVFRVALMQKYRLDGFELSQAYLFFWDKLEKSNWFLEQVIGTAAEPLDGRLVQHMLAEPISDGGQWDMVCNLVDKYGLVPQTLYPDSVNAKSSGVLNSMLHSKLREYALVLRKMVCDGTGGVSEAKTEMMKEVHAILTLTLGPPPAADGRFEWTFTDRTGTARTARSTPLEFARGITPPRPEARMATGLPGEWITSASIEGYLSLVHDPRHGYYTRLTVDRLGNIVSGRGVSYINVPMAVLKTAVLRQLRAGIPTFFGCDVGKFSDGTGTMDLSLYDYGVGFGVELMARTKDRKADRLRSGESQMTHAMVLTGCHVDGESGETVRWKVMNSWGEDRGEKGWWVMSDGWMDEFVYQAVVDPRFVGREVRDVLDKEAVVLPLWDPMGSLA